LLEQLGLALEDSCKEQQHFVVHKPVGFISQFVQNERRIKGLLGDLHNFPEGTMAIGRLDADSEGLLLLTTDGKESFKICSRKVEKEYYVQLDGLMTPDALSKLQNGVEIGIKGEKYMTLPCEVKVLDPAPEFPSRTKRIRDDRHGPTSWASITIREGKNRQVRKMTAAAGLPTLRLIRVRIGNEVLGDLKAGEVKEVKSFNVD